MKLLLCRECGDVVAMRHEPRSCACGAAMGRYLDDRATVVQTEGSISIALHNHDLRAALDGFDESPDAWHPLMVLRAYVNPRCETDVVYVGRPAVEGEAPVAGQPAGGEPGEDIIIEPDPG